MVHRRRRLALWLLAAAVDAFGASRQRLDLGVAAGALASSYRACIDGCSAETLENFVNSAVAALDSGCTLPVLLMEVDMDEADALPEESRAERALWLRTVRLTLDALDDRAAGPRDAELASRVERVVDAAQARGLQLDRPLASVGDPALDHLVLLAMRARTYVDGDEAMPGAT